MYRRNPGDEYYFHQENKRRSTKQTKTYNVGPNLLRHITKMCKKACAGIGALSRTKPFVPLCTPVTLYRSLIEPYFDYCSPLWDMCGKQLKDKLQKIKNRAGRVITGSSYDVRSADALNNLNWKTLETRRFHTKATLMYKILNYLSAPLLSNSFVKLNDTNINYNLRNMRLI